MDFSLTPEQLEVRALARDFAQAEIAPHAASWDRERRFPAEHGGGGHPDKYCQRQPALGKTGFFLQHRPMITFRAPDSTAGSKHEPARGA